MFRYRHSRLGKRQACAAQCVEHTALCFALVLRCCNLREDVILSRLFVDILCVVVIAVVQPELLRIVGNGYLEVGVAVFYACILHHIACAALEYLRAVCVVESNMEIVPVVERCAVHPDIQVVTTV